MLRICNPTNTLHEIDHISVTWFTNPVCSLWSHSAVRREVYTDGYLQSHSLASLNVKELSVLLCIAFEMAGDPPALGLGEWSFIIEFGLGLWRRFRIVKHDYQLEFPNSAL